MARPKLTAEQRLALLTWLSADYSSRLIRAWFRERAWPLLADSTISYYRAKCAGDIDRLRAERRDGALKTGLALKEERVARLQEHADELEIIKWRADLLTGKLPNEKAWRETLAQIAKETGGAAGDKASLDDVLRALPAELRDAVRHALTELISGA